jgi:hypothetical protein
VGEQNYVTDDDYSPFFFLKDEIVI